MLFGKKYSWKQLFKIFLVFTVLRKIIYMLFEKLEQSDFYNNLFSSKKETDDVEENEDSEKSTTLGNETVQEGFQTYDQCRNLGYSKSFCVQTPVSVFGPAGCMCADGRMGQTYPGLRGGCLCN